MTEYTATTSNNYNKVTASANDGVTVEITVNETEISNGANATWSDGDNVVSITASGDDLISTTYTVTVTKE